MKLKDLIAASGACTGHSEPVSILRSAEDEIAGITAEAPRVTPGMLYAAVPGGWESDIARVPAALGSGAVALLLPEGSGIDAPDHVAILTTRNVRRALAFLSAALAGVHPRTVVAITGTCGKTSTADFVRQLWTRLGHRAASIGTAGLISPDWQVEEVAGTTPHPNYLHPALAYLVEDGVDHVVLEATSHALDQHRIDALPLTAAAFTNLSRDHLNYHGSMAAYFAAKQRLFADLLPTDGAAVLNADSDVAETMIEIARRRRHRLIRAGRAGSEIRLLRHETTSTHQVLEIDALGCIATVAFRVIGAFQVENLLVALGLAIATGADPERVLAQVEHLVAVRGRLEQVAITPSGATVYVDYAHKPGAMEALLSALRRQTHGRLVVVFGCGGQADAGNRDLMGAAAAKHADTVIITDDNPRYEDPSQIRAQIRAGAPDAVEIADRAAAIRAAMHGLKSGDTLVIAGKGHETCQTIAGVDHPFDDAAVAREIAGSLNPVAPLAGDA